VAFIIGAVCQKPIYWSVDTFEKTWQRRLVADVFGRQFGMPKLTRLLRIDQTSIATLFT
jgi:hypothetical protein